MLGRVLAAFVLVVSGLFAWAAPAAAASGCAWSLSSLRTNALFPDTSAAYWITPVLLWPGSTVEVSGEYPAARYFSLQTYTLADGFSTTVGGVRDRDVVAEAGSENPFAAAVGPDTGRDWKVTVAAGDPATASGTNVIRGLPAGQSVGVAWLMYRTYLTDDAADPSGGSGLPEVTVGGKSLATCPGALTAAPPVPPVGPSRSLPVKMQRQFFKAEGRLTPFPNEDNKYLAAVTTWAPGKVFVVRFRSASTPDTRAGEPAWAPADLRYWSVCQNGLPSTRGMACLVDADAHPDDGGIVDLVISAPADRPAGARDWLPYGPDPIGVIAFRTMLPAEGFHHAVQDVASGEDPAVAMEAYAPVIGSCTRSAYEMSGPAACLASS